MNAAIQRAPLFPCCGVNVLERARTTLSVLRSEATRLPRAKGDIPARPTSHATIENTWPDSMQVWRPFLLLVRITALARVASAESIFPDYSSDYSSSNKSIIPRWDDVVKFYRENYFASLERGENFSVWRALLCCVDFICAFLWLSSRFYRTPRETSS